MTGADVREQVWLAAWIATASRSAVAAHTAAEWADFCLEEFDKRFPAYELTDAGRAHLEGKK